MKKKYVEAPAISYKESDLDSLMSNSITGVDGNTNIDVSDDGEIPKTADSRRDNLWDDDF